MRLRTLPVVGKQCGTQGTPVPHRVHRVLLYPLKPPGRSASFQGSYRSCVVAIFGGVWWCIVLCTCYWFFSEDPTYSFLTREMADQPGHTRFQALFDSALQAYEQKTSITLAEHPLAVQLQSCDSVESIIALLLDQARSFSNFRESDRIIKSIKTTISILNPLSVATSFASTFGLVCQNECADFHLHILDWFADIPTCESNTGWSCNPTFCMCRSLLPHLDILVTSK